MSSNMPELKVARLIQEHELEGMGNELERRWTRAENRSSLRDLADYFNRELLRTVLESEGATPLNGEVENYYRLLTDDEATSGVKQQVRNQLEDRGINVDALMADFVSYQSIRTYLKQYREVKPPNDQSSEEDRIEQKRATIQRLANRLVRVTEQSLSELANTSRITIGDFSVIVTVRVHCSDCDTQQPVTDLLTNGGCACEA
ncbi:rod-determining factor RdfA [Halosimplex amylolyticum]|uniref:rod-determining factor RdfA n=1 Tax=Halosimplex amylolyticum TaxID=3396616 RepID=UPI003F56A2ED